MIYSYLEDNDGLDFVMTFGERVISIKSQKRPKAVKNKIKQKLRKINRTKVLAEFFQRR